jgi:hypothetical protein
MTKTTDAQPVAVPAKATRTGEIWSRWPWVEPTIWTERMLTALEQGVKGGTNVFFAEHGLYNLKAAHALACQSSSR